MTFGALLLGVPGKKGLDYVGKVGTGFTAGQQRELLGRLRPLDAGHAARSPLLSPRPTSRGHVGGAQPGR